MIETEIRPETRQDEAEEDTGQSKPLIPKKKVGADGSIENEHEIVEAAMECYAESSRARAIREPLWMDCLAFNAGDQNFYWSTDDLRFVNRDRYLASWRSRHVQNAIEPAMDQVVSLLAANQPSLVASPASTDFEDTSVAEVGTAILEKLKQELKFGFYDELVKRHKAITGTAALEVEWDPTAGVYEPVLEDETVPDEDPMSPTFGEQIQTGNKVPVLGEDGQVKMKAKGAFKLAFWSTLELYLDPTTPFYDRWRYLITATTADKKELERQYGIKLPDEDDSTGPGPNSGGAYGTRTGILLREAADYFGSQFGRFAGGGMMRRGVTVIRLHIAPCEEEPLGRLIIIAGENKILYDDISPARGYFRFPVTVFYHRFTGQSPYGDGIVKSLISVQRELNRTVRQMIEHRELCLRSKWVVDRACAIEKEAITSEPGEIIFYDSGSDGVRNGDVKPPHQINPTPIPESLFPLLDGFYSTIDRISGIFEAQRGQVPTGIKTGVGLQALQGQTVIRLAPVQKQDFAGWCEIGRQVLWQTSQYWPDGVKVKYTGRNMEPSIKAFDRATFAEPVDVQVENHEGLPNDPSARQTVLAALFAQGGPMTLAPDLRKLYFSLSRMNDVRRLLEEENGDEINTRRKYQLIVQDNIPQQADYWEDHAICRRVLKDLRLRKDYYDLPPATQEMITALDQSHAAYLAGTVPTGPGGQPMPPGSFTTQSLDSAASTPQKRPEGSAPKAPNLTT